MRNIRVGFKNLDVILITLIICMNINRFYLGGTANMVTYPIYFLFIVVAFFLNSNSNRALYKVRIYNQGLTILSIAICCLSMLGSITLGIESMQMTLKLVLSLIIAYGAAQFPIEKIKLTISYVIIYNLIYSVTLLLNPSRAQLQMKSGVMNYLNITMTLGLVMTICLCQILIIIYGINKNKKETILYAFLSGFTLAVMSRFNSRGSILIPLISFLIVLLLIAPQKPIKVLSVIIVVTILGVIGYNIYINYVSGYAFNRMMRLFNDTDSEMRVDLWSDYINEIIDRHWYLLGGGANVSRIKLGYYPHNLYLQLIGEYGIIGFLFGMIGSITIISRIVLFEKKMNSGNVDSKLCSISFICISCLLYYFLTFMKSFSFFDAYPLFIFFAFTYRCIYKIQDSSNSGYFQKF